MSWRSMVAPLVALLVTVPILTDQASAQRRGDGGLGVGDRLPVLKRWFVDEAAGLAGDLPRLLKGEGA